MPVTRSTLLTPTGRECFASTTGHGNTSLPQQEEDSSSSSNSSANEKSLHAELPVSSNDSPFTTAPPKSRKELPLSFVSQTTWFTIRLLVPNYNCLLFLDKPILLEKHLVVYLFKVNNYNIMCVSLVSQKDVDSGAEVQDRI